MAAETVTQSKAFDFKQEVERMLDETTLVKDHGQVVIWGGKFTEDRFSGFVDAWDFDGMLYVIQEQSHRIAFVSEDNPSPVAAMLKNNHALLERAEVFGGGGNLSLRRNSNNLLWHFIGANDVGRQNSLTKLQAEKFEVKNFWQEHSNCQLRTRDESALLWGDYNTALSCWQDDRVGWADLSYPITDAKARQDKKRVQIDYTVFTEAGQVAFVWWKELRRHG